ncbi:MAG: hypothetical protein MJ236_05815 [Clostridia bacterium]|nr:hypothetical protein [Clostridia bacterium]
MKKIICFVLTLLLIGGLTSITAIAAEPKTYTEFDIRFDEKNGEKVNETKITVFASVDEGKLVDRTEEFTLESVDWFKYVSELEPGKTTEDYDYVDEALNVYGYLCSDDDAFDHENYSYFLRIGRLFAQDEDTFYRNIKINGIDIEDLNGICYNAGNEFFIKTITNGMTGSNGEDSSTTDGIGENGTPNTPDDNQDKKVCKVCGICPFQPLGICLFIWFAIIVLVVIVLIMVINKKKKNK